MSDKKKERKPNRYSVIIQRIFDDHYVAGDMEFEFKRNEAEAIAAELDIQLPKNIGDIFYSFRYRNELPEAIKSTAEPELERIIIGAGRARYRFKQAKLSRIVPCENLVTVKIPDATPKIIGCNALNDEQGLLTKVRYNRLINIFLGIAAYSLQNHLRTTVEGLGPWPDRDRRDLCRREQQRSAIRYLRSGQGRKGQARYYPNETGHALLRTKISRFDLPCRAVSAQFMEDNRIAMFELTVDDSGIKVVRGKHYKLVSSSEILSTDFEIYARME